MKQQLLKRNAILISAFLFLSIPAFAQTSRPDFNRTSTFDVQHYVIRVSFDRVARKVIGDTTVRLKMLREGLQQVRLDSVGISYSSVTLEKDGTPLGFHTGAGSILITLDRTYSPNETIGIRFHYTAVPKKGVYFVPEVKGEGGLAGHSAQIWTQGEPEEARHWFPSFDFPGDKATTEQYITANRSETVVGNGTLVEKTDNSNGTTTHHFRMDVPFSTYLVSFVVGEYAAVKEKYKEIPLGYYVYPGTESVVPKAYGKTREMLRVFEEVTQVEFPFAKYDQTIVSAFNLGGMENVTATTMSDTEILLVNNPIFAGGVEDLVSHELAHSWFGNLVTCKNWAELWLNEGFATFMEAVSREKLYGRRAYIFKILGDAEEFKTDDAVNPKRHGLFNRNAANVDSLFERSGTTYHKGSAVLHTLREEVGDRAFWQAVKIYLDRHRFGNVETTDLKKVMEETSGTDLGWFFDQWVYGLGSPKMTVKQAYNAASKTLSITVTQTQRQDRFTPLTFKMAVDVDIHSGGGVTIEKIQIDKRLETFRFKVSGRPTKLVIDKDEKIPLKTVKILPLPK
jgi:aminopeptidase N